MAGVIISFAIVIFVFGIVIGVMVTVSIGIHREERYLRDDQRARQEGLYHVREVTDGIPPENAPDRLTAGARRLSGLTIRRPSVVSHVEADRDLLV